MRCPGTVLSVPPARLGYDGRETYAEEPMSFTQEGHSAPKAFKTLELSIRPIRASDAEADFAALMDSREDLRRASRSPWPDDHFSVERNRDDLARHQTEHEAGDAYTYTVMDPEERVCLGCIYMVPLPAHLMRIGADDEAIESAAWDAAAIYFWVRSTKLREGFEAELLSAISSWMAREKAFSRVLYSTHTEDSRQVALFRDAGLREAIRVKSLHDPVDYLYFEA
jgi:RimJ/RimL family protein N-acetyltransferase